MFFLIKLCCLETEEPRLLLAREVAREMDTDSLFKLFIASRSLCRVSTTKRMSEKRCDGTRTGRGRGSQLYKYMSIILHYFVRAFRVRVEARRDVSPTGRALMSRRYPYHTRSARRDARDRRDRSD